MKTKEELIKDLFTIQKTSGQKYKRVGPGADGGYVMADDLKKTDFSVSCGIGDDIIWNSHDIWFENQLSEETSGVDMYECAVESIKDIPKNGRFFKAEISKDVFISDILKNAGPREDYILKMDIEGAEWDFFLDAKSDEIAKFRQIALEFHWIKNIVDNKEWEDKVISVLSKIKQTHSLVLLHGVNCSPAFEYGDMVIPDVMEVLFLRKDSYSSFVDEGNSNQVDQPEKLSTPCRSDLPYVHFYVK